MWLVAILIASTAYAEREVDRPLVIPPGLSEASASAEWTRAARAFDGDSQPRPLADGDLESAATASVAGRYGLFQGAEVWFHAPYVVQRRVEGRDPVAGMGRASFGARYEIRPLMEPHSFVSASAGIVLPSTARSLRTDAGGVLHRDHLAVSGALAFKHVLLDSSAAWGRMDIVFPFANEDDDDAERDPPATYRFAAGSLFQLQPLVYVDAGAQLTRTNRDRINGDIVPGSDQYRVDLLPAVGIQPYDFADARIGAAVPVAGKNTSQAYEITGTVRVRF